MTKREILSLINAKKIIEDNEKFSIVINNRLYQGVSSKWLVDKDRVNAMIDVLKKEVDGVLDKVSESEEVIKNLSVRCNHEVRLRERGFNGYGCKCIFCGKNITDDNFNSWDESINRNRHSVTFDSNVGYDEDEEVILETGYGINQIFEMIIQLLEGVSDNAEVDLVEEFKRLNLSDCVIRDEKFSREVYMMIVCGSNRESIKNGGYISIDKDYTAAIRFLEYFKDVLNVKVCFVSSDNIIKANGFLRDCNASFRVLNYSNLKSIRKVLEIVKDVPFKCIVDFSKLFTFSISDNLVNLDNYSFPFSELFTNVLCIKESDLLLDDNLDEACKRVRRLIKDK